MVTLQWHSPITARETDRACLPKPRLLIGVAATPGFLTMATLALAVYLAVELLLAPLGVEAQPPARIHRIGFLGLPSASSFGKQVEALRAGLRELVRLRVDVLVTHGTPGALAAKRATTSEDAARLSSPARR